jgi:hypothetical protein
MTTVKIHPPSGRDNPSTSPLPSLLQTPSGLALLELQGEVAQTAQDVQGLQEDIAKAELNLVRTARSYGMVPAENPTMFSVETGKVVQGNAE